MKAAGPQSFNHHFNSMLFDSHSIHNVQQNTIILQRQVSCHESELTTNTIRQKKKVGLLQTTFRPEMAPHTGHSSQLFLCAYGGDEDHL